MKRLLLITAISFITIMSSGCWRYQAGYRGGWLWNRNRPNYYDTYYRQNCCSECGTEVHSAPESCSSCGSTITSSGTPLTMPAPVLPAPVP